MIIIETLQKKLDALRKADPDFFLFGAETHQYISHPLREKQIVDFEKKNGITLPHEYREFLLHIGYGMGPGHQLYPLERLSVYEDDPGELAPDPANDDDSWEDEIVVDSFEDITQEHVNQVVENYRSGKDEYLPTLFIRKYKGVLLIGDAGGTEYIALIVKGALRGTIWELETDSSGAVPAGVVKYTGKVKLFYSVVVHEDEEEKKSIDTHVSTFYEWINTWVDEYLQATALIPR